MLLTPAVSSNTSSSLDRISAMQLLSRPSSAPSGFLSVPRSHNRPMSASSTRSRAISENVDFFDDARQQSQEILAGLLCARDSSTVSELQDIIPQQQKAEPVSIAQSQLQGLIPSPAPLPPSPNLARAIKNIPQVKVRVYALLVYLLSYFFSD